MNRENLTVIRNLFLQAALISVLITWIAAFLTMGLWNTWIEISMANFKVSREFLSQLVTQFFTVAKFFTIYLLLVPGLALHWTVKTLKS
ncbi:hypothetical protein KA183_02975 [bacterium]|nr:hypothetical protein [bacterium]QQR58655.1 MAG: hypothetical protein IPG59_03920 [Candidatus Melainabacteria bacterium]